MTVPHPLALNRNDLIETRHLISGLWCAGLEADRAPLAVHDPADLSLIATVPDGGAADALAALEAAQAAWPAWKALPARERAAATHRAAAQNALLQLRNPHRHIPQRRRRQRPREP